MSNAAHLQKVEVSTNGSSYTEADGISKSSFKPVRDLLETTDFKDTSGAKTRIAGLKDASIDVSGDLEMGDTNGLKAIIDACDAGSDLWFKLTFNVGGGAGLVGITLKTLVESYEVSDEVAGKVEFSASAKANGAWAWF